MATVTITVKDEPNGDITLTVEADPPMPLKEKVGDPTTAHWLGMVALDAMKKAAATLSAEDE